MEKTLAPIPPGATLLEEFLKPMGISQSKLSRVIDIPASQVSEIVYGSRTITADTVLRLAEYLGTSAEIWLKLQTDYDLRIARTQDWPNVKARIRPYNAGLATP